MTESLKEQLKSDRADLKNTGERWGGAISAAHFLHAFAKDVPWAHLDIAGPSHAPKERGYVAKGGTGFAVRTLVEFDRLVGCRHGPDLQESQACAPPFEGGGDFHFDGGAEGIPRGFQQVPHHVVERELLEREERRERHEPNPRTADPRRQPVRGRVVGRPRESQGAIRFRLRK
jgi:hypothetical protein